MTGTLIQNIGEFFTGDIAAPTAPVRALLIDGGQDCRARPAAETAPTRCSMRAAAP